MRFSHILSVLAATAPFAEAYYKGFNVAAENPDGSCKSTADWTTAFSKLKALPQYITSVRVFASSDCNTLVNAIPAARSTGIQLLVGVWTEDEAHFTREKNALENAIKQYGQDWILAISVGSEDLYRGDTSAWRLAQQIYDVRGMVRALGVNKEVGHVDTWNAWVNAANAEVIRAVDFVGVDAYPYFQSADISAGNATFWTAVQATRDVINRISPGKWVWITETGWPVSGDNFGAAVPSVKNAQTYWRAVACSAFTNTHVFWYAYQDFNLSPSFGIFDRGGNAIYDLYGC